MTSQAMADDARVLRAGVFNTAGVSTVPYVFERIGTMASKLPELLEAEQLDVLCLNELWEPEIRNLALSGIVNNPDWHVYQPEPLAQSDCAHACIDHSFPNDNIHPVINLWVQSCALTVIPEFGLACANFAGQLEFQQCVNQVCPDLFPYLEVKNPTCGYCLADDRTPAETKSERVLRCADSYDADSASQCRFASGGEADGTLISRFPFLETEYHPFTAPDSSDQPGLTNRGITYGKIQSPYGPVHLFCSHLATTASGMNPGVAEPLNVTQSEEVLDYIQSKAQGEMAVFLADTGSGPALALSPPVNAEWPQNFDVLQAELSDALLSNLDENSQPQSAASATYECDTFGQCGSSAPGSRYVDHIMTSGQGTPTPAFPRYKSSLLHRQGGLFFTSDIVLTTDGIKPLSDHFGVRTDIYLDHTVEVALAGGSMQLLDPGDASKRQTSFNLNDAAIDLTGLDPRVTGATAYVGREGVGTPQTFVMPAEGWLKVKSKTVEYHFRSSTGPVTSARLRDGKVVKLSAKGSGAYPLGAPQGEVGVIVEVGDTRFCGLFGGVISKDDGKRFLARKAPVSENCPALGSMP